MIKKALVFTAGDTLPAMTANLDRDLASSTVNVLIGYSTPLIKTATVTNAGAGEIRVDWAAGDLQQGRWPMQIEIINGQDKQTLSGINVVVEGKIQ